MIGKTIREITADIKKCDFRGCTVFGKFQNSRAKLEYTEENLPKEYIDRLIEFKVPNDAVLTTDTVYLNMLERRLIRGINGIEKVKQMVDYNLTEMKQDIWKYRKVIRDFKIDISYTGAFFYQYGMESIGKENYYIDLEGRAKEAYFRGDLEYVESVFKDLDKDTKRLLVTTALKDGREKFAKRHKGELKGVQKKYLQAKASHVRTIEEQGKVKGDLIKEYMDGKLVELEIDMSKVDVAVRSSVVEEIYRQGNLDFTQKYLDMISSKLKNDILVEEYKKGNIDFVYRNFGKIDNGDLKENIISKEIRDKNFKFLYENYPYIYNRDVKDKILKNAYKEGNIDFLNEHINDMPKSMKLEAAIRYKDLKLSKEEMVELLKR